MLRAPIGESMIDELDEFAPAVRVEVRPEVEMAISYTDRSGRRRVKGGRHLKSSQSYPIGFLACRGGVHFFRSS